MPTTLITPENYWQRQITLLGQKGQQKIQEAKVLIVGAGGLGHPCLQYLVAAGISTIGLVDFDKIALSNLQRQVLFSPEEIGEKKVKILKDKMEKMNPFCQIMTYDTYLDLEKALEIFPLYDLILDCTDNFTTKFLIHDCCWYLKKVLIQGSVYQYEGQLLCFDFRERENKNKKEKEKNKRPCWRCLWKKQPEEGCTGTCAQVGVLGPILGVLGNMMAMEALKVILEKPFLENGKCVFVDLLSLSFQERKFTLNSECLFCQQEVALSKNDLFKNKSKVIGLPNNLQDFFLIDVRTTEEFDSCSFVKKYQNSTTIKNIPLNILEENLSLFQKEKGPFLFLCSQGIRSLQALKKIENKITNEIPNDSLYSLGGGIQGWS